MSVRSVPEYFQKPNDSGKTLISFADTNADLDSDTNKESFEEVKIDLRKKPISSTLEHKDPFLIFNFNDPLLSRQWHLYNKLQIGNDINVAPVWEKGITGKGVVVCIIDDGIDHKHKDISRAFREDLSYDFNEKVNIPIPNPLLNDNHGTRCAGLIAGEANNRICGVGVAYDANVSAIRILSKSLSTQDEAAAVVHKYHENHIFSCSWGPADNGFALDGPSKNVLESFVDGLINGRSGKGSIYVFAAGNGKSVDNCNFDGYANGIFSTTIGAIDNNNAMPIYMEPCSAQLAVVYSSGYDRKIVTTDLGNNSCTMKHGGTSAAAPIAAGIFALALSANPDLSWRDIQYLCVETAIPVSTLDTSWQKNGAGKLYSQRFGFGKLDADRLVTAAQNWSTVAPPLIFALPSRDINRDIPIGTTVGISDTALISSKEFEKANIPRDLKLEQVTVTVDITHSCRGNLQVFLSSPSGMIAQLATRRPLDSSSAGLRGWTFMTVAFWGEKIDGPWTINVVDKQGNPQNDHGKLIQWRLTFWGTSTQPHYDPHKYSADFIGTFYPSSPDQFSDLLGFWSDLEPVKATNYYDHTVMNMAFITGATVIIVQ